MQRNIKYSREEHPVDIALDSNYGRVFCDV
jgi:hypothetical protein